MKEQHENARKGVGGEGVENMACTHHPKDKGGLDKIYSASMKHRRPIHTHTREGCGTYTSAFGKLWSWAAKVGPARSEQSESVIPFSGDEYFSRMSAPLETSQKQPVHISAWKALAMNEQRAESLPCIPPLIPISMEELGYFSSQTVRRKPSPQYSCRNNVRGDLPRMQSVKKECLKYPGFNLKQSSEAEK